MDDSKTRSLLHEENEEFRRLEEKHRQYEKELESIPDLAFLSPEQQLQKKELKKRKLQIKDKMHELMITYQKTSQEPCA